MSTWTHIAGVIRVDTLGTNAGGHFPPQVQTDIMACIPWSVGSEGPFKLHFHKSQEVYEGGSSLSYGEITLHGDLRVLISLHPFL